MDPDAHLKTLDAARVVAEANGVNTVGWTVYHAQVVPRLSARMDGLEPCTRRYSLIGGVSENFHPEDY